MSKRYKVIKGTVEINGAKNYALIGIVDKQNYKNSVNAWEILTNLRVSESLNSMGLDFKVSKNKFDASTEFISLDIEQSKLIKPNYDIVTLDNCEIWNLYLDGENAEYCKTEVQSLREELSKDFSTEETEELLKKFCSYDGIDTPYDKLYNCINSESEEQLLCYDYKDLNTAKEIVTNIKHGTSMKPILTDMDTLSVNVPSYKDIMLYFGNMLQYKLNTEEVLNAELNLGADTVTTSHFGDTGSTDNNYLIEYYMPENNINVKELSDTDYENRLGESIKFGGGLGARPNSIMFNLGTVNVRSISNYYNFAGPERLIHENDSIYKTYKTASGNLEHYNSDDILGRDSNNELEIQPEELSYFKSLKNLIDIGISIEHNAISQEVFDSLREDAKYSEFVEYYLRIIAEQAFNLTQVHTATTSNISYENDIDTDKENDESGNELTTETTCPFIWGSFSYNGTTKKYVFVPKFDAKDYMNTTQEEESDIARAKRENRSSSNYMEAEVGHRIGTGFTGSTLTTKEVCLEEISKKYENKNHTATLGNLSAYVNTSTYRYRWAEAVIRLLRFGRKKPKLLYISNTTSTLEKENVLTGEFIKKEVKCYYNFKNLEMTKLNPNNSTSELYNPIPGSNYKIAAFLSVDMDKINTSTVKLNKGTAIVGAILMQEYNDGIKIDYKLIDMYTLMHTAFRHNSQIGMLEFKGDKLAEIDNSQYSPYAVLLDGAYEIRSLENIPIIDIRTKLNGNSDEENIILSHIFKGMINTSVQDELTIAFGSTANRATNYTIKVDKYMDKSNVQEILNKSKKYISKNVFNTTSLANIIKNINEEQSFIERGSNILQTITKFAKSDYTEMEKEIEMHSEQYLQSLDENKSKNIGARILTQCFNYDVLMVMNKCVTEDNLSLIEKLNVIYKNLNNDTLDSETETQENMINKLKYQKAILIKGHSENPSSEPIGVCLQIVPINGIKMAIVSYDVYKQLNLRGVPEIEQYTNTVNAKNKYNILGGIMSVWLASKAVRGQVSGNAIIYSQEDINKVVNNIRNNWPDKDNLTKIMSSGYRA